MSWFPARFMPVMAVLTSGRMGVAGRPVAGEACQRLLRQDFFIQRLCYGERFLSNELSAGKFFKGGKMYIDRFFHPFSRVY